MLNEEGRKARFVLEDTDPNIANALRRAMINMVPTLAVEDVLVKRNDSALYNEILALRLGLIPLKTDLKAYQPREDCECGGEGCSTCEVHYKLEEEGPKMVRAKDIEMVTDKEIKPVYPEMPIVKLTEDQELKLELIATMNRGEEHTKWSPCLATYQYYPVIEPNGCSCEEAVEACPRDILKFEDGEVKVKEDKLLDCNLCEACADACENGNMVVKGDDSRIIFEVESWGQLTVPEIIKKACGVLQGRLDQFRTELFE